MILGAGETFGEICRGPGPATVSLHGPGASTPRHEHAEAYVCVVLSGGFEQSFDRRAVEGLPGAAIVHEAGSRHADRFGAQGAVCLNLHVEHPELQVGAVVLDAQGRLAAESLAAETALGQDRLTTESLAAELVDRLLRPEPRPAETAWLGDVLDALQDDPARDWTLDQLAKLAGRHPTHLARGFRSRTGLSLGAFRRRRRLTSLCLALRLRETPLAQLAAEHGYADQAHMTREFRRFAGASPAAWRRAAR